MNFNGRNNQRVIGSMVSSGSSRVCRVTVGRSREEDIYVWDTGGEARSLAKRLENIRNLHANQRCIHVTIVYVTRKLIRFMGISPVSSEIEESRCLGHENHSFILLSNFITQQIKRNQSEKQKIRSMIKFYSRKRIHYIYTLSVVAILRGITSSTIIQRFTEPRIKVYWFCTDTVRYH